MSFFFIRISITYKLELCVRNARKYSSRTRFLDGIYGQVIFIGSEPYICAYVLYEVFGGFLRKLNHSVNIIIIVISLDSSGVVYWQIEQANCECGFHLRSARRTQRQTSSPMS